MATSLPKFTPSQKNGLRKLGVLQLQITELEIRMPTCKFFVSPAARLSDVRHELETLGKVSKSLTRFLVKLEANNPSLAVRETAQRLQLKIWEQKHDAEIVAQAKAISAKLSKLVEDVSSELSKKQRRRLTAHPGPIGIIETALLRGWGLHHFRPDGEGGFKASKTMLRYPFPVSRTPASPFYGIASICYELFLGSEDHDPDRAIRAFLELDQKRRTDTRLKEAGQQAM